MATQTIENTDHFPIDFIVLPKPDDIESRETNGLRVRVTLNSRPIHIYDTAFGVLIRGSCNHGVHVGASSWAAAAIPGPGFTY